MSNSAVYHPIPPRSQIETDVAATVLLGHLWLYAFTVLYPAQLLKSLGLYTANEIGAYPQIALTKGEGQFFCRQYQEPWYLDHPFSPDISVEYFDRISTIYESCMEPFSRPIYEEAVTLIRPLLAADARILDVSCGPGTETLQFAALVPVGEVVGMDLSAGMISTAFEKAQRLGVANTSFFQADVTRMPENFIGCFDATVCFGAFHHYLDPLQALTEMHRALNLGGRAFIVDPGPEWFNILSEPIAQWADPGWVRFYTGEALRELFSQAGFSTFYWTDLLPGFGLSIGTK
jgi:SAM-dependent methyltransferase